jgi:hypothetical protein
VPGDAQPLPVELGGNGSSPYSQSTTVDALSSVGPAG